MQVEPGKQPWLDDAPPGAPDNAGCADCWLEVADVIFIRFGVPIG